MNKLTFKEFSAVYDEPLNEEDARRLQALKDRADKGDKGAEKMLNDLISSLSDRDRAKADVRRVLQSYAPWKKKQREQDKKFADAKADIEAGEGDQGSSAWRKETGSVRRAPKGSMGTIPTRGTV